MLLPELVLLGVAQHAQVHTERPQPLRDGVDRGGGHHEQSEDGQQHQQRYGEDLGHGVRQRGGRRPADQTAGVPYALHAVAARGRAAGDVDLAEHADDERGQADHDPSVGLRLLRVPDEPYGDHREQYRNQQVEPAEGAGDQDLDQVTDGAAQVRPGAGGDDQGDAEQQQRDAVLAVGRVEVLRALPYASEDGADGVRQAEPEGAHEPVQAPGRAGRRLRGRGPLRRDLLGGRLLGRGFLRGGLLRRSLRGSRRLLGGLLLGCGGT